MTNGMTKDERIAAYLDGHLDDEAMAAFEAEMEQDATLADEMARLADNDALLRAAFEAPLAEKTDDMLLMRMGLATPRVLAANDNSALIRKWRWPVGGALAASAALALFIQAQPGSQADAQFARAMDSMMSRQTAQMEGGATLTPVLSFRAADGRYCREYVRGGVSDTSSGIACRDEGGWTIEAQTEGSARIADSTRVETASGADDTVFAQAYARLGASDPLDAEKEQRAIADGWKKHGE